MVCVWQERFKRQTSQGNICRQCQDVPLALAVFTTTPQIHCCQQLSHRAVLKGDERPAAAWEETQALCWPTADPETVQRLLLTDIPNLQDA